MESSSEPDTKVENIVEKYEDCTTSEEIHLVEDEQSGDQILGYLEVQGHNGTQDATIYLDSQGLNLNGKRLILTHNDEGIIVVVSNDPNGQPLEGSVIHPDSEQEALVVAGTSEGLEFLKTENTMPPESDESHVYIDNNKAIEIENKSPLWSEEQTSKSTEMLFIPNPTVMVVPEETKHPKLMQLACIAHQLQSTDTQKECNETSVIVAPHTAYTSDPVMKNAVSVIHVSSELYNEEEKEFKTQSEDSICENVIQVDSVFDSTLQSNEQILNDNSCKNLETLVISECTNEKANRDILHGTSRDGIVQAVSVDDNKCAAELTAFREKVFRRDSCDVVSGKENYSSDVCSSHENEKAKYSNLTIINQRTPSKDMDIEKVNEYNFSDDIDDLDVPISKRNSYSPKKYSMFSSKSKVKTLFSTGIPSKVSYIAEHDKSHPQDASCSKDRADDNVMLPRKNLGEENEYNALSVEGAPVSVTKEASVKKFRFFKMRSINRAVVADIEGEILSEDLSVEKDICRYNQAVDSELNGNNLCTDQTFKTLTEDTTEETHVKPPKKTYIKQRASKNTSLDISHDKIELFSVDGFSSCDKDIEQAELSMRYDQQEQVPVTDVEESSQALPSVGIQVSATYNRKKKSTVKQARRLRRRFRKSVEEPINILNKESSENIAWADVLLRTSFDNPTVISPPQSQPTPRKQKRKRSPKKFKPDSAFDSLLQSSTLKNQKMKSSRKFISDIVKKAKYSRLKNRKSTWTDYSGPKVPNRGVKRAQIRFSVRPKEKHVQEKMDETDFSCSSCDFVSTLVNNLIEHLKYCEKRQPPLDYPVDDMDKRQRIRGEDIESTHRSDSLLEFLSSGSFDAAIRGECSGTSQTSYDSDEDMDFLNNKFGYGEDDVVWAKVEDRFWPALVCSVTERRAYVKLISYPTEEKGLKKPAERVHTFHDAKWNKMLLAEATDLPHNEIFVKAVQTSETYVRKKWLGLNVKGKDFFSIPDEILFTTDEESCDSNLNDDSDFDLLDVDSAIKPSRKARYKKLNVENIKNYILEGNVDVYVLDIFHRRQSSQKHMKYFSEGGSETSLTQRTWFGPCEKMFEQGILLDYFHSLFLKEIGERHFYLSYILEVWIPEAIVKAISDTHRIPLKEAETLFESDDSSSCSQAGGKEDPNIKEIEKILAACGNQLHLVSPNS